MNTDRKVRKVRRTYKHRFKAWHKDLAARITGAKKERDAKIAAIHAAAEPHGLSRDGAVFIADFEGFVDHAYRGPGEQYLTIGYGHYGPDVHAGQTITKAGALDLLRKDAAAAAATVLHLVKVALSQTELDALISFTFNVGPGNFAGSTLLKRLNAGDRKAVPGQLALWTHDSTGAISPGLVNRRKAEGELFAHGTY